MKRILLVGATGLTGSSFLDQALLSTDQVEIIVLGRRHCGRKNNRLQEQLIQDKQTLLDLDFAPVDVVVCCLGSTIKKAGSKEAFYFSDVQLPIALAQKALGLGAKHFVLQSSLGADSKSSNFYLKCKGELEEKLSLLAWQSIGIVRPSLLLGNRSEFRLGERISEIALWALYPFLRGKLKRYRSIQAKDVAKRMLLLALNPISGIQIFESEQIPNR